MFETSTIEISKSALNHNLNYVKSRLNVGVKMCCVVKGNAYGHGLVEYVSMAMSLGVDYFAVHAVEEAFVLSQHLAKMPNIFIMGAINNEGIKWAIKNNIEFAVFNFNRLNTAINYAKELNVKAKIHIEIETGMRRTGFDLDDIESLSNLIINENNIVDFVGLFTHYAGAESQANHFRITKQIDVYHEASLMFAKKALKPIYYHSACSAALLNYPETQGNMVRVGIIQYGFWPNKETQIRLSGLDDNTPDILKRVIRWKTTVMSVKDVVKGNFIGYGTSYLAQKNLKLAIIPIGYSHGYSRKLSNIGNVLINGKFAPVVGTVNMNSLSVDITKINDVKIDDEVVLIGNQNSKSIGVNSFSEQSMLLNYEMLTRLPLNIPRKIVK